MSHGSRRVEGGKRNAVCICNMCVVRHIDICDVFKCVTCLNDIRRGGRGDRQEECAAATYVQLPSCCSYTFLYCTLQLRIPRVSLHIYMNNVQLQHTRSCPLVAAARPYVAHCSCPLVAATHSYVAHCSCEFLVYRCIYVCTMCSCNMCAAALLLQLRIPMLHVAAALFLQLRISMLHVAAAHSSCIAVYMYVRCAAATCAQLPSCCSCASLCCTF